MTGPPSLLFLLFTQVWTGGQTSFDSNETTLLLFIFRRIMWQLSTEPSLRPREVSFRPANLEATSS